MGEVLVVDSEAHATFVPPPRGQMKLYILFTLLGMAIAGLMVEGALIYQLYTRSPPTQTFQHPQQPSEFRGETPDASYTKPEPQVIEKPAAFLHGKDPQVNEDGVMQWQTNGLFATKRNVSYHDGYLRVQVDGLYNIYSKVHFTSSCSAFIHQVFWMSEQYKDKTIVLMQSIRQSCHQQAGQKGQKGQEEERNLDNSYLGGVFQLHRNDRVFVKVENRSSVRGGLNDNFFGLFML